MSHKSFAFIAVESANAIQQQEMNVIVDSGSSFSHIVNDKMYFTNLDLSYRSTVLNANNCSTMVEGKGEIAVNVYDVDGKMVNITF